MRLLLAVLCLALPCALLSAGPAAAAPRCAVVAAPNGSDRAAGTVSAPLRTAQAVIDRLGPGQTGCLRAGVYSGRDDANYYVARFNHGGARHRPLTLRSYPGEHATLSGVIYVPQGSDDVTVSHLTVDDPSSYAYAGEITIQVDAKRTQFLRDTITNHAQKTCMLLGIQGWGRAIGTVVRNSVFHDCGDWNNGVLDHAIYSAHSTGIRIIGNLITRTGGYGVHMYPDTQRAIVRDNVITNNGGGIIFAGEGREASSHNVVTGNVVSGSVKRPDISSYWGQAVGTHNVATGNCVGARIADATGFAARGNVVGHGSACGRTARAARLAVAAARR